MNKKLIWGTLSGILISAGLIYGASTTTVTADFLRSSDRTKTQTLPSATGTLLNSNSSLNASNLSSGTVAAARLPNPSSSTLGGIESLVATTHQWINTISTSGVPSSTQPAFTDISGTAVETQGGTNQATYTKGDILYASGSNTLAKLGIGSTGNVLTVAAGIPSWGSGGGSGLSNPTSEIDCDTGSGAGSSNTTVRTFTNCATIGTDLTYTSSGTNGDKFVANTTGVYAITYSDISSGGADYYCITKNGTALSTSCVSITIAQGKIASGHILSSLPSTITVIVNLATTDIIRAQATGNYSNGSNNTIFHITRVN